MTDSNQPPPASRVAAERPVKDGPSARAGGDEATPSDPRTSVMTVTLIAPTWNEIEAARVVLPQIKREWVDEIIIVDGGSTDGTVEFCQELGLRVYAHAG